MQVLIDADGCPVVEIAIRLCRQYNINCLLLCDTAHEFYRDGAQTLVFDKGADSVDYALVNRVRPGDVVVTRTMVWRPCAWPGKQEYCTRMDGNIPRIIWMRCC